jgi:lysophospholipase L1-like esterase
MRLPPRSIRRIVIGLGIFWLHGCSGTQSTPTPPPPVPDPPRITCPAPITLPSSLGTPISVVYGAATTIGGESPVTTACVPASGSIFPVGPSTVTCTATDQRQRTDSCTFTVRVTVPPRISVTNFVAFGDSMTAGEVVSEGLGGIRILRVNVDKAYPAALKRKLDAEYTAQSIAVQNQGLSRETAADGVGRLGALLSRSSYEVLLLLDGANDLVDTGPAPVQAAIAAMRAMVQMGKARGMKVFLATLPPQNPNGCCPNRSFAWSLVVPYNDGLRALAASENIQLIDVYQAFNGDITTLVDIDGLHPTPAGYERIADEFYKAIRQTFAQSSSGSPFPDPFQQFPTFRRR